jgi:hypothetical protein
MLVGWAPVRRLILSACLLLLTLSLRAAEPEYLRDIAKWQEVAVPSESDQGARMAWFYAANYSKHEWRVFTKDGQPQAQLSDETPEKRPVQPSFIPEAGRFHRASACAAVDDGWLIGFNQGEFGAALYWFSRDGKSSYKISDHQVVDFFSLSNCVYAIEGLAHLSLSQGSVICITRRKDSEHWQATSVAKLPFAPYAVSLHRDGTMLITLSDSLVAIGSDHKIRTLLPDAPWGGLYPNSSVLSQDGQILYIGMRQFVGEFDLITKKLRLLIPARQFLNKLPKKG